jgi:hypothetical protein
LGFNVHAGVTVHSGDREGLERLCRYGAPRMKLGAPVEAAGWPRGVSPPQAEA